MELKACRCCCCQIPLSKACRIIGITFAVLSAISVVKLGMTLAAFQGMDEISARAKEEWEKTQNMKWDAVIEFARNLLLVQICVSIMWTVFSVLLVVGVAKESKCLVMSFIVFYGLAMTLSTVTIMYSFHDPAVIYSEVELQKLREQQGPETAQKILLAALCVTLVLLLFFWYLFLVVFSYYRHLTRSRDQQEFGQIPMV